MPSENVLLKKQEKVKQLVEKLKNTSAAVFVNYEGITVEEDTNLRRELRASGVDYSVEKNTMLRFALNELGMGDLTNVLEGTTALAVSTTEDQTAPARVLGKYAKELNGKFTLKAGFIGDDIYDEAGVTALSKIPSKEVLLSQLVGSLQGPMQSLAAILKAVADSKGEGDVA